MAYKDPENTLILETTKGNVVIELFPDLAPGHVERIKELARAGEYDGVVFHRVIEGFMAQTGDVKFGKQGGKDFNPARAGMGGSDKPDLKAEFSNVNHGPWCLLDGAFAEPEFCQLAVLHLLRRCLVPEPSVHGLGARLSKAWTMSTRSSAASRCVIRIRLFLPRLLPTFNPLEYVNWTAAALRRLFSCGLSGLIDARF